MILGRSHKSLHMGHTDEGFVYRSYGGVGNNGTADNGTSGGGGGDGGSNDGGGASGTDGAAAAGEEGGEGGGERKAPAGGEKGRGGRAGGGGPRKYSIPSSELKKLDQLFLSEDDKLTYDGRQTPRYTAGTANTWITLIYHHLD